MQETAKFVNAWVKLNITKLLYFVMQQIYRVQYNKISFPYLYIYRVSWNSTSESRSYSRSNKTKKKNSAS